MQILENTMTKNLSQAAVRKNIDSINKQAGMTLIGSLLVTAFLVLVAIIGMKIVPAYIEYFSVKTVLHSLAKEPLSTMSNKEIMDSFDRHTVTTYVDVVSSKDLIIEKNSTDGTVVSVDYQVRRPILANVSVLIDFNATTDGH
jgi:hypothetical protein